MMKYRVLLASIACAAVLSICLAGCGGQDTKQEPGAGGKGLSPAEKQAKKGD